ncbi:unnamed protein product [Adineta steineri]|uniref:Uncharacterized protein n=1 Tax=Adineta steineri TaxID=433720 RepID=A0A819TYN6_9BILA|nr:unnamed protein product [Adineta steineri]
MIIFNSNTIIKLNLNALKLHKRLIEMNSIDDIISINDPDSGEHYEYTDDLGPGELFDFNNVDSNGESISNKDIEVKARKNWPDDEMRYAANRETKKTCSSLIKSILFSRECLACTISTISMLVGILIVVYTMRKKPVVICDMNFALVNPIQVEYNYQPQSVAVGDFNNDTWMDIVVANRATNNIAVLFGYGKAGLSSTSMTYSTSTNSTPCMVTVGDFNNDGRLDIVVANYGVNNVGIFLGIGKGAFESQTDLNNDKAQDIIVVNYGTQSISIFYGDGNGKFSNAMTYFTGYDSIPMSITVGDFNNDKHMDIAIANSGTNNVGILLGNENDTFITQNIFPTGYGSHPYSIATHDFNGDNFLDIVVANHGTHSVGVHLGNGNGSFTHSTIYSIGNSIPIAVVIGDMNNDNHTDLVVTNNGTNDIAVFIGYSNGSFRSPTMYSTGSLSSVSVAITDFNNDVIPDIVVIHNETNAIGILLGYSKGFLNQIQYSTGTNPAAIWFVSNYIDNTVSIRLGYADGLFGNETIIPVGSGPQALVVSDFNGDGHLDIIVANYNDSTVSVLLGYGTGSFANQMTYATGQGPSSIAIGDFNNDTYLDLVLANGFPHNNTISVLLGQGDGTFGIVMIYAAGNGPWALDVGDFNNDTILDVVVVNSWDSTVSILLGIGDGSFPDQTAYPTGNGPQAVVVGDFNNDGKPDFVVANRGDASVSVYLGYGNASFTDQMVYSVGSVPNAIVVGNFSKDAYLDIVVANQGDNDVSLLLGFGNGSFATQTTYSTGLAPNAIAAGDFNNDSLLDVVVGNLDNNSVSVLLHFVGGDLTSETTYASGGGSDLKYVIAGDFNNDTHQDLIVANFGTNNIGVLFGNGTGTFANQINFTMGPNSHPASIAAGDFNKDGQVDLAVANYGTKYIGMLLGNGKGWFTSQVVYGDSMDFAPLVIAAGDFYNDGQAEIVVAYDDRDNVDIFSAFDTGFFSPQKTYPSGRGPWCVAMGDFNNDNQLDIVVVNTNDNTISILFGYGNGSFAIGPTYLTIPSPSSVVVADFNNDTQLDIVVGDLDINYIICVYSGYGNGSFAYPLFFLASWGPGAIVVGDFNNDNKLDIIVANFYANNVSVLLGNGQGLFIPPVTYPIAIATGDFNNDTQLDIVVANNNDATISVLLGYGNGSFADQVTYPTGSYPYFVAVGDFNNDTRLDIVVANDGDNNVDLLLGYGDGSFANQTTFIVGNSPQALTVGDVNNDTRLDIVVVNTGDNTASVLLGFGDGTFREPTVYSTGFLPYFVALADFNSDKRLDIIVANYRDDRLSILFGYVNFAFVKQITLITGNGSQPKSFAIDDFNKDNRLDIAVTNSGTNNMGIFLSYANGSFALQKTYATGSSPRSIASGDFNNDTILDIVVANSGSDSVSVLFGYENGSFLNQTTFTTGFESKPYTVAVGHFNKDIFLDIAVINYGLSNVYVFLGYGNDTLVGESAFTLGFGSSPISLAVADFNNDKQLDFAVVNEGTDNLKILLETC